MLHELAQLQKDLAQSQKDTDRRLKELVQSQKATDQKLQTLIHSLGKGTNGRSH